MLIMGADKFYAKWLSPSCFLVVFAFYSCIDFHKKAGENAGIEDGGQSFKTFLLRRNLLYIIVSSCFLVSASVLFIGGFFPDLIGKVTKTQYPYAKLSSILYKEYEEELALTKDGKLKLILVTNEDPVLKGNLVLALERSKFKKLLESGDCQLNSLNEGTVAERASSRLRRTNDRSVISSDAEYATRVSYASKRKCKLRLLLVPEDHEEDESAEIGVWQYCHELKDSESGESVGNRLEPKALLLYVWDVRLYGRSIPKAFQAVVGNTEDDENAEIEDCEQSHKYKLVKVRYINSEKQYYELGVLARKSF